MNLDFQTASTDAALKSVADERRRTVLQYLIDSGDGAATVDELVDAIAARSAAKSRRRADDVSGIRTKLHHVHLPKLANAGVIDYDARSGAVRYRPDDRVEAVVRFVSEGLKAR